MVARPQSTAVWAASVRNLATSSSMRASKTSGLSAITSTIAEQATEVEDGTRRATAGKQRCDGVARAIDDPTHDARRRRAGLALGSSNAPLTLPCKELPAIARTRTGTASFADERGAILRHDVADTVVRFQIMRATNGLAQQRLDHGLGHGENLVAQHREGLTDDLALERALLGETAFDPVVQCAPAILVTRVTGENHPPCAGLELGQTIKYVSIGHWRLSGFLESLLHRLDVVTAKLDPLLPAEQMQQHEHAFERTQSRAHPDLLAQRTADDPHPRIKAEVAV